MIIDKSQLRLGIWFEDKDGKRIEWDSNRVDPPPNAVEEHVCFPLEVRETVYKIDHNGNRIRECFAACTHIGNGDILVAMVNSGDFTLTEAIALYANCCERCANVLEHKYLGPEYGYPEHSEEWEKCNTSCRHCVENYDEIMKEAWLDDMKKADVEVVGVDLSEDAKAETSEDKPKGIYKTVEEDLSEKEWNLKKAIEDPGYKMFKEIKETCF